MTRRPRRGAVAAFGAAMALTLSLSGAGLAQEAAPALTSDITEYPNYGGGVDCEAGTFNGSAYTGNLKRISAPDPMTVVFEYCVPNVTFIKALGFGALAIDDADYLINAVADGSIVDSPNGTGPLKFVEWDRGNRIVLEAFPDYWGEPSLVQNVEFRWNLESAARLTELLSGQVDGIDNPGPSDIPTVQSDDSLNYEPRDPASVLYIGMNNTFEPWDDPLVRQAIAKGIDSERIVTNFYPEGSDVAKYFVPCAIQFGCEGEPWYDFDPEGARALLAEAGFPDGFSTKVQLRASVRPYIPEPEVIAQEIAAQLKTNLNIDAEVDVIESAAFLDGNAAGTLDGLFLLGWIPDFADPSNYLDYHVGPGTGAKFGEPYQDLVDVLAEATTVAGDEERAALYAQANNLYKEHVPAALVAWGASGTGWQADVEGAHSSPLGNEDFSVMKPGDRDTLVWMQNSEPPGLYCADETDGEAFRVCIQIKEALYGSEVGGFEMEPKLATECSRNEDATVWTCSLREGATFHDGATFDASDVIVSYAAMWDAASPQHVGRTGAFDYWSSLIAADFLN